MQKQSAGDGGLTERQRLILETIRAAVAEHGYPPSMREIGEAVGLDQPVVGQAPARRARAQGLRAARPQPAAGHRAHRPDGHRGVERRAAPWWPSTPRGCARARRPWCRWSGRIAAGGPILAEQAVEDVFPLPRQLVGDGELFLLKVVGESMIDAAICDGDWVVVRRQPVAENGEIVAAMIDGEATVKTFQRRDGHVLAAAAEPRLLPHPGRRGAGARPRGDGAAQPLSGQKPNWRATARIDSALCTRPCRSRSVTTGTRRRPDAVAPDHGRHRHAHVGDLQVVVEQRGDRQDPVLVAQDGLDDAHHREPDGVVRRALAGDDLVRRARPPRRRSRRAPPRRASARRGWAPTAAAAPRRSSPSSTAAARSRRARRPCTRARSARPRRRRGRPGSAAARCRAPCRSRRTGSRGSPEIFRPA